MATQTTSYGLAQETAPYGDIVAGDFPLVTEPILLGAGSGTLARGTVLGKITATGKYVPYDDDGTDDGRRVALRILAEPATLDGTDDTVGVAFRTGMFKASALAGLDSNARADLDAQLIFVRD